VSFILYRFIRGYIFEGAKEFIRFQARILLPFLLTIPFYFFHNYLSLIAPGFWAFTGISLAAQAALWLIVIIIFYRGYLSIYDFKVFLKEVVYPPMMLRR
jgi:hypothetical protein